MRSVNQPGYVDPSGLIGMSFEGLARRGNVLERWIALRADEGQSILNDFGDNVFLERYGYYKPYAELDGGGQLALRGYPLPNVDDFGFRENADGLILAQVLEKALSTTFFLPDQQGLEGLHDGLMYAYDVLEDHDARLADQAIAINDALLREIRDAVEEAGKTLLLVPVPTKCEYSATCQNDNSERRDRVHRILEATADRLGIRFVPTFDVLDSDDSWLKDGHWKPSGHDRIAERIAAYLGAEKLLD